MPPVADSSEATLVQEGHEEAESDENHHVHILKEGVTRHLRWRGVLSEQTTENNEHQEEGQKAHVANINSHCE